MIISQKPGRAESDPGVERQVPRLPTDMDLIRRFGYNVLLIGTDEQCGVIIDAVRADLAGPVVTWRRRQRLVLPPPGSVGTIILHGVDALDRLDQERVLEWLNAPGAPRVVSAAAASLLVRLRQGAFLDDLYYRLNIISIQATNQHPTS